MRRAPQAAAPAQPDTAPPEIGVHWRHCLFGVRRVHAGHVHENRAHRQLRLRDCGAPKFMQSHVTKTVWPRALLTKHLCGRDKRRPGAAWVISLRTPTGRSDLRMGGAPRVGAHQRQVPSPVRRSNLESQDRGRSA
jgi:hypothetical protein